ncbi:type II secretion system protein [Thermoproteota archaeon]
MKHTGFTLIELIMVIAVIGLLASIMVPNMASIHTKAKETVIKSIARSIQISVETYNLCTGIYPVGSEIAISELFLMLNDKNIDAKIPNNPFTGAPYTASDSSGKINYSYDESQNSYYIQGFGKGNNELLINISNTL